MSQNIIHYVVTIPGRDTLSGDFRETEPTLIERLLKPMYPTAEVTFLRCDEEGWKP